MNIFLKQSQNAEVNLRSGSVIKIVILHNDCTAETHSKIVGKEKAIRI